MTTEIDTLKFLNNLYWWLKFTIDFTNFSDGTPRFFTPVSFVVLVMNIKAWHLSTSPTMPVYSGLSFSSSCKSIPGQSKITNWNSDTCNERFMQGFFFSTNNQRVDVWHDFFLTSLFQVMSGKFKQCLFTFISIFKWTRIISYFETLVSMLPLIVDLVISKLSYQKCNQKRNHNKMLRSKFSFFGKYLL